MFVSVYLDIHTKKHMCISVSLMRVCGGGSAYGMCCVWEIN